MAAGHRSSQDTLGELWSTRSAQTFRIPREFRVPDDPVSWACSVTERASLELGDDVEQARSSIAMESKRPGQNQRIPLDSTKLENVREVLAGLRRGLPVHIRVTEALKYSEDHHAFYKNYVMPSLERHHFMGFRVKATLWLSASEHHYAAHTDLADGVLFQLTGRKRVTVWNLPAEFYRAVIYDVDFEARADIFRANEPITFELEPGEAIFIPRGALHEVHIPKGECSIAISFRAGSPYFARFLCAKLNDRVGAARAFDLLPELRDMSKFRVKTFDPVTLANGDHSRIPPALSRELEAVIHSDDAALGRMLPQLLEEWWTTSVETRSYPGFDFDGPRARDLLGGLEA